MTRARAATATSWCSAGSRSQRSGAGAGVSPRSSANCRLCMGTFQVADAPIIRPDGVGVNDAGEDTAGMQQVGDGPERCQADCFTWRGGIEVRPRGGDERTRTVGEDENQIELAVTPHPAEQPQRLAFKRVAGSDDSDRGRIPLEVGSVRPFRSTMLITIGYGSSSATESTMEDCFGSLTNGSRP